MITATQPTRRGLGLANARLSEAAQTRLAVIGLFIAAAIYHLSSLMLTPAAFVDEGCAEIEEPAFESLAVGMQSMYHYDRTFCCQAPIG